jgi:site-specific DNA recombinase
MGKAIVYLRVSTEEQAEKGFSLQAQREECFQKLKELNCDEMLEFCDEGVSGSILERPMLLNALDIMKQCAINYFICYDPSRLSRNVSHQLILIDNIKKFGARLIFVRSNYEDTAEGRFQLTIMSAVDEYERARLKIRTELGKRTKANQKLLTHNPNIYGYIFDKESDTLHMDKEQSEVVKLMFNWLLLDKLGPAQITDKLNDLCIPSMRGKLWNRVTVSRILRNYSYTGTLYIRRYDTKDYKLNKFKKKGEKIKISEKPKDQWVDIEIPAIISKSTWEKAILLLSKSKRIYKTHDNQKYLLSGLLTCGMCGGTLFGKSIVKNGKSTNRYYCCMNKYNYNKEEPSRCKSRLYKADELETVIWEKVRHWIINKEEIKKALMNMSFIKEDKSYLDKCTYANHLITQALKEKEKIIKLFQKEIIDEREFDIKIMETNNRIKGAKDLQMEADHLELDKNTDKVEFLNQIENAVDKMSLTVKNKILCTLIKEIKIKNNQLILNIYIPERITQDF